MGNLTMDVAVVDKEKLSAQITDENVLIFEKEYIKNYAETQEHNRQIEKKEQIHRHSIENKKENFGLIKFVVAVSLLFFAALLVLIGLLIYAKNGGEITISQISALVFSFTLFAGVLVKMLNGSGRDIHLSYSGKTLAIGRRSGESGDSSKREN